MTPRSYSPPYPKVFYWRVGLTTSAGTVWSATSMFQVVNPPDRVKPRVRAYAGSARRGRRQQFRRIDQEVVVVQRDTCLRAPLDQVLQLNTE